MTIFETGRVCVVTAGADKGREVVVKGTIDDNFVTISGEKVKERRCNVIHLQPTGRIVQHIPVKAEKPKKEIKPQAKAEVTKKAAPKKIETKKKA